MGIDFSEWLILVESGLLSEVDWEGVWADAKVTCTDPAKIVEYLNAVRGNAPLASKDRQEFPSTFPIVHSKSRLFGKEMELDVGEFKRRIMEMPSSLVTKNTKMEHSGRSNEFVYNTGVPAFRGIVYDVRADKFVFLNTCPGAFKCVNICYARDGIYLRYPDSYDRMTRALNLMMNYPDRYEKMLFDELSNKCKEHNAYQGYTNKVIVRWNDSGDFFADKYREIAHSVMRRLKDAGFNIEDNVYTRIAAAANDPEFDNMTFSYGAAPKEAEKVTLGGKIKQEITIPYDVFKDLDLDKISDMDMLKDRVADKYELGREFVISYPEMMAKSDDGDRKWHVIVASGHGDDASYRKDVRTVLNTEHSPQINSAMARRNRKKRTGSSKKPKKGR
jgi:hypothetical protein